jgi:hypothetical protein
MVMLTWVDERDEMNHQPTGRKGNVTGDGVRRHILAPDGVGLCGGMVSRMNQGRCEIVCARVCVEERGEPHFVAAAAAAGLTCVMVGKSSSRCEAEKRRRSFAALLRPLPPIERWEDSDRGVDLVVLRAPADRLLSVGDCELVKASPNPSPNPQTGSGVVSAVVSFNRRRFDSTAAAPPPPARQSGERRCGGEGAHSFGT